jgi:hypothetical protein
VKTIYFNIQSKGGAGKSMLTYLQAIKNEQNERTIFVDMDGSTLTSSQQLEFLKARNRLANINLLDSIRKIERDKIITSIETLNKLEEFEEIYLDFGAPESEQIPNIFSVDFTAAEFKDFETELTARFVFNIVVAGGASYQGCFEYLKTIAKLLGGLFEIFIYVNEYTFYGHEDLIDEIKLFAGKSKGAITGVKTFGNLHPGRYSTKQIIEKIMTGKGFSDYNSFSSRTVIKREIAKL